MRVAFVVEQCLNRVPGGTGRYTIELGRALAASASSEDSVEGWAAWHRDLGPAQIEGMLEDAAALTEFVAHLDLVHQWRAGLGEAKRGIHARTLHTRRRPRRGADTLDRETSQDFCAADAADAGAAGAAAGGV